MLRAGVRLRTAPWTPTLPWQTIWRQKDGIRCHVGRVFDSELFSNGVSEYVQNRFPRKKPVMVTSIDGQMSVTHNDTSVSRNKGNGIITGSVKLYYNSVFGRGEYADSTVQEVSSDLGYVFWAEALYRNSSRTGAVYLIINRTSGPEESDQPKWIMSLVDENQISNQDFKIACITGSSCVQIWQSDITYAQGGGTQAECYFPFKISVNQATGEYIVSPGSINGTYIQQYSGTCNGTVNLYAQATDGGSGITGGSITTTSAQQLTIPIGTITGTTQTGFQIYQMLTNSLYWERFKCGSNEVEYYCNGV
jgi:hypothetical protein